MVQDSIELFFSYSHKDEALRDELATHLRLLERRGLISSWHDRRISAGTEWKDEIDRHLKTADIILLLVSSYFINSDYCWDVELELAMQRHESGEARVIPIVLRPVNWRGTVFGKLQALPRDAKPITSWTDPHEAFADVALRIEEAIEELLKERQRKREAKPRQKREAKSQQPTVAQPSTLALEVPPKFVASKLESIFDETLAKMKVETLEEMKVMRSQPELPQQSNFTTSESIREDDLTSESGVDYTKLRDLLKAKKWREADRETYRVMIEVTGRIKQGFLDVEAIKQFPCDDLQIIDQLWVKFSDGLFGFSTQKQIYIEAGNPLDGTNAAGSWEKFCRRVRWMKRRDYMRYSDATFDTNAAKGHLPLKCILGVVGWVAGCGVPCSLFSRQDL
jgi:hypothetical protein